MPLQAGVPKGFDIPRREIRVPIEVRVQITCNGRHLSEEKTFTQNVSSRGARVWTNRRWRKNERLTISIPAGEFQSIARVAYCQPIPGTGYAVGLELLEPTGKWVFDRMSRN